jgi:hypothetical protein
LVPFEPSCQVLYNVEAFTEKNAETLDEDLKQLLLSASPWLRELMVSCAPNLLAEVPTQRPGGRKGKPAARERRNSRSLREVSLMSHWS